MYACGSIAAFLMFLGDKVAAKRGNKRIPELNLLGISVFGGWPGALLAMLILRHKTKKTSFQVQFAFTVPLNIGLVAILVRMFQR